MPEFPRARCRGLTWLMYPPPGDNANIPKNLCAGCEHRVECAEWAIDNDEEHGIWGGTTPRERRRIRRQRIEITHGRISTTAKPC